MSQLTLFRVQQERERIIVTTNNINEAPTYNVIIIGHTFNIHRVQHIIKGRIVPISCLVLIKFIPAFIFEYNQFGWLI